MHVAVALVVVKRRKQPKDAARPRHAAYSYYSCTYIHSCTAVCSRILPSVGPTCRLRSSRTGVPRRCSRLYELVGPAGPAAACMHSMHTRIACILVDTIYYMYRRRPPAHGQAVQRSAGRPAAARQQRSGATSSMCIGHTAASG